MKSILVLVLPVIWVGVAATLAIWLYKSSAGWFEHESEKNGSGSRSKTTLRLAGSSVTAAVFFLLVSTATQQLLAKEEERFVKVPVGKWDQIRSGLDSISTDLGQSVEPCITDSERDRCKRRVEDLHARSLLLRDLMSGDE